MAGASVPSVHAGVNLAETPPHIAIGEDKSLPGAVPFGSSSSASGDGKPQQQRRTDKQSHWSEHPTPLVSVGGCVQAGGNLRRGNNMEGAGPEPQPSCSAIASLPKVADAAAPAAAVSFGTSLARRRGNETATGARRSHLGMHGTTSCKTTSVVCGYRPQGLSWFADR